MTLPAVTLIRMTIAADPAAGVHYVAIRSQEAVEFLAETGRGGDVILDTRPWPALAAPALPRLARSVLAGNPRSVAEIGIALGGSWVTWNPPCEQPPVPDEDKART
jgi:hypothetical protein